ncbi:hypothetical protein AVEN_98839-1 [Araneus ventricosus]|uniref:Uncharacterized protein n=1 Tax=Araneus ventricosus TaxID=182803 RepID=A0A4Y2MYC0_ARAVE|nr:hypothetical protein AVEN_98839-1 [Araneus ventricosus]
MPGPNGNIWDIPDIFNSLILRPFFFILAPLKPGVIGRKRHELDSLNLGGHLSHHPTLSYNLPLRRRGMGNDDWTSYRTYLLSDLSTSPPLTRSQPPQTGFCRC